MSKVITSPIERFSGTVVLSDPLTYPQLFAFEDALRAVKELDGEKNARRVYYAMLPGIIACVEEWHLEGVPDKPRPDTFPASPGESAARLVAWLLNEVTALNDEANDVPLVS